jgi:hydroxyquinol 1,2-dioxygenase
MPELNETNVTDVVIETFANCADARLQQIMTSLIRHVHDFAREVELTPEEWLKAIQFFTEVGQKCSPERQEFILLSDTMGLSALVNLMNSRGSRGTASSLLGPFFRENAPALEAGQSIARGTNEAPLALTGRIEGEDGTPIPGARIDVWQTASTGLYDIQGPNPEEMNHRGQFRTDRAGRYAIATVLPLGYSIPTDGPVGRLIEGLGRHGMRPAHIHFLVSAPGYRELATALYIAGDANIDSDAVFGVSSSLVVAPKVEKGVTTIAYDFRLQRTEGERSGRVGADPSKVLAAE